jgi:hypothetical protein
LASGGGPSLKPLKRGEGEALLVALRDCGMIRGRRNSGHGINLFKVLRRNFRAIAAWAVVRRGFKVLWRRLRAIEPRLGNEVVDDPLFALELGEPRGACGSGSIAGGSQGGFERIGHGGVLRRRRSRTKVERILLRGKKIFCYTEGWLN